MKKPSVATIWCLIWGLIWALLAASSVALADDTEIVAIADTFADGNIHTAPAWVGGDLNWFNPYFVETLDGTPWATARQYGSMGTAFTLPPDRIWPIGLDPGRGLMRVSLTVRFKPGTGNNFLDMHLVGVGGGNRISIVFDPNGAVNVRQIAKDGSLDMSCPVPKMLDGKPVRFEMGFGGDAGFVLLRDGKEVFRLDEKRREPLRRGLGSYHRIAFIGSQSITQSNETFMSPSFKDAEGSCWITDIEVRGVPERVEPPGNLGLHAAPKSLLALRGVGGLDTSLFAELAAAGWTVKTVADQTTNPSANPFQSHLTLESLLAFECVAVVDVAAPRLGLHGCAALREYARQGGKVLIFGGVNTLNRGRYFGSPLAECLPVVGTDGLETLVRDATAEHHEYAYQVARTPQARTEAGVPLLYAGSFGKGRVVICPWTTLGTPATPFWRSSTFAGSVIDALGTD